MLRFVDSFDHYQTANILEKWTSTSLASSGTVAISAGNGRRGSQSFRSTAASANNWAMVIRTLDNQAIWIVGFAFRMSVLPFSAPIPIFQLRDAGTSQVELRVNLDGTLSVTRNGSAVTGGTSVIALSPNTYYYIEHKATISDSIAAGSWKVRVNGVDVITVAAGQDSKNTANATANQVVLGAQIIGSAIFGNLDFDDVYILDGNDSGVAGNSLNDFLGDVAVEARYPSASGTNSSWTPIGAPTANQCWDEILADGDGTYTYSSITSQISSCTFTPLSRTPSIIYGMQIVSEARKDDAGSRSIANYILSSGSVALGPTSSVSDTYSMVTSVSSADPHTSVLWTVAAVNAMEAGVKLTF